VLKQGKIFWFKSDILTPESVPRGVIDVSSQWFDCARLKPQASEAGTCLGLARTE